MYTDQVRRLPVIGPSGRLAGIISRTDMLAVSGRSGEEIRKGVAALPELSGDHLASGIIVVAWGLTWGLIPLAAQDTRRRARPCPVLIIDGDQVPPR